MTNQFLGSISAAADGREEATGLEARCRPPLAGKLCHQPCGPRSSLARGRVPPLPHARELLSGGDGEELSFAGAVGEQEEGGGRRTGGDARQVVRAPCACASLANWRRWNRTFLWSEAKRPIWLAVAWLRRLARQPNMGWVAYGSLVGG